MRHGLIHRLCSDTRGVAAVEFALIAPLILVIYVVMVQVFQGYMADRRAGYAASIVGDMVAQNATLVPSQVDNVLAVGSRIMRPFSDANLTVRVTSVVQSGGDATVAWSRTRGSSDALRPLSKGAEVELPDYYKTGGGPIILTESEYDYQPLINFKGLDLRLPTAFSHTIYHNPRAAAVNCASC